MSDTISNDNTSSSAAVPASLPDESRHVPAPRWSHYETDLSSVLAFAPPGTPLEIVQIAGEQAGWYSAQFGLGVGDRITRLNGRRDDVLLSTDDGRRVRVALPVALGVEVEPALPS